MINPLFVRQQIENLKLMHPEIWEDDDHQLLLDTLEGQTDLHEFFASLVHGMRTAEAFILGMSTLMEQLKARRDRYERREEVLRGLALKLMQHANVRKIELPQATLSIRAGQPRVIVTDEARLPEQFVRIKREPDKHLIASHLKAGERVDGAELSNSEETLAVRVK